MSKIFNKILSCVAVLVMVLGCGFLLTACGDASASKVMNLSLNPSIELMLDANNKVVSVSANNDEGNFIIANATFVGLSAEEAVDLFLEINYENGFIIKGTAGIGENKLEIELSGDEAEALYNKVKESANAYLTEVGANVQIELSEVLNREDLESLVEECMQELSDAQINSMSEEELLEAIKSSREETKNFLSEELKELYYESRAEEIIKEKFDAVSEELSNLFSIPGFNLSSIQTQFETVLQSMKTSLSEFKAKFEEEFLSEESDYQVAMREYIEAKKALLEARLDEVVDTTEIENILANAKTALDNAESLAESAMSALDDAIESAIETLNATLNTIASFLNQENIDRAIESAKNEFNSSFKNEFNEYINNNYWDELKPETVA